MSLYDNDDFAGRPSPTDRGKRDDATANQRDISFGAAYADDAAMRDELEQNLIAAGLSVQMVGNIDSMLADKTSLPGVTLCHIEDIDQDRCAALGRLDRRFADVPNKRIIACTEDAVEGLFRCFPQSNPQILVTSGSVERILALGRATVEMRAQATGRSWDENRAILLKLSEQVDRIAVNLSLARVEPSAFRLYTSEETNAVESNERQLIRTPRPALPDPRLVRSIIRQRQLRGRLFPAEMFADPAWDILLDLTAARAEHTRVSVTSLCIASGVPPTTALRWIGQMVEAGLLERSEDEADRRRAFIKLSDKAAISMAKYFSEIGNDANNLV